MTGAEHYAEAERLIQYADSGEVNDDARPGYRYADLIAAAQVHATLALAAPKPPIIVTGPWSGGDS